jgi:hypothetical protein
MQSTTGPGNAGSGKDMEISAFHPGEMYGRPVGTNPLEGWSDAKYHKPDVGKLVMGWTGRFMCKVVYDYGRGIWVTNKGTPVKVMMWNKSE